LQKTLKELGDTEASLRQLIQEIEETQRVIDQCGGNRHATQVIAARTVAVMKRKATLLQSVEGRMAEYEAMHMRRDEILKAMEAGNYEAPPELCGVRKFVLQHIHKNGDPVDADKSDFNAFVKTFLLPSKHGALERFRAAYEEASNWWAQTTASVAAAGAEKEVIKALITMTVAAGADREHPYLLRAEVVLRDRIADRVLKDAREAQERDKLAADKAEMIGKIPLVGMAEKAADAVTVNVRQAVKDGVPESDTRIADAKAIAKALREADGQRKRMANREKNKQAAAAKAAQSS